MRRGGPNLEDLDLNPLDRRWDTGILRGPNLRRGVHIRQRIWTGGPYPLADLDPLDRRWDTGIFETPKDIDDFTNCPTHRSNLGVGWNRGSNSRCRVPKEMSGHGKGRVKSIPKADR